MSSLTRRMQLRTKRKNQRALRNNPKGTKLGFTSPCAAKALSLTPRGSRRRIGVNTDFRAITKKVVARVSPYAAPTRAERQSEHKLRMERRRIRQLARTA